VISEARTVISAEPARFAVMRWLRGFLDALGITHAAIVVGPRFAAQVLGFALTEPDRIRRLVFLVEACGNSFGMDGDRGLADRLERAGQSLLVAPLDQSDSAAFARSLAAIELFLRPFETRS
jgi:pimeloyl-ACP methyl ester carboxylesterase